jgi:molybdopterin converting factor small subunit
MVEIIVRVFGTLKELFGWSKKKFSLNEASNVSNLLKIIFEKQLENRKKHFGSLDVMENPFSNVLILVNGIEVNNIKGLDTPIFEGDLIDILSIIHGG